MSLTLFLSSSCTTHSIQPPGSLAEPQQETQEAEMHVHCLLKEKGVDQVSIHAGQATSQIATMNRLLKADAPKYMITEQGTLEDPRKARWVWASVELQMHKKDR